MEWLATLLPESSSPWLALTLLLLSSVTSFVTAAFGIGGGVLLLAAMTLFFPAATALPLHGVIQLGSNAGRSLLMWRHIDGTVFMAFSVGGVIGITLGAQVMATVPDWTLELLLGLFILWSCYAPMPAMGRDSPRRLAVGGAVTSALTLFVGATGPMVGALLRAVRLDRRRHVGTFSACMTLQHSLKILVFGLAGFAFAPYAAFLIAMITFGLIGTWLGRLLLETLDERLFRRLLTLVLTLIAMRLLYTGIRDVIFA